ncbi:MAG: 3-isopropylmalate dehydratase large subunit [Planctomycetota bacterium]|jgi:3-isopropylmalate/(R)-2-methylmalate dehydratase large subunit
MTIAEKILARHADAEEVRPGQIVEARIDLALGNDITAPLAIEAFEEELGGGKVFDPERVVLIPDHFTPNKDIKSAEQAKVLREFARRQGLVHYYEVGRMGIEHALLPELGLVGPGDLVIGADSHTCTYGALGAFATGVGSTDLAAAMATGRLWFRVPETVKVVCKGEYGRWVGGKDLVLELIHRVGVDGARYMAIEFAGGAASALSVEGRLTVSNMAIEAGAKAGIFPADGKTDEYLASRTDREFAPAVSDDGAELARTVEIDVSGIVPLVAKPHLPSNVAPASECGGIQIDQVVIGSCTNGRIEDLRIAAEVLAGRKVAGHVRLIVIPATQAIYKLAMREGLAEAFIDAGAAVSTPTCGPCLGGHMGCLAAGERAVATTNRNFVGRMGHPESEVYLAGPAVAAASAVAGRIAAPEEVLG